jgi:hypothetical protein
MADPTFENKLHPLKVEWHGAETHSDPANFTERMRERMAAANGKRVRDAVSNIDFVVGPIIRQRRVRSVK